MQTTPLAGQQVGMFPAPWSSTSTPGKVSSVWDKIVPKAPLPVYTTARPLLVLRTPSAVSVCPAVPALAAGLSPSITVVGVTASNAVEAVGRVPAQDPVVPAATLGVPLNQVKELLDPFQKDGPLGKKGESLSVVQLRARSRKAI